MPADAVVTGVAKIASSDDWRERLTAKLAALEARREAMKTRNAEYRTKHRSE